MRTREVCRTSAFVLLSGGTGTGKAILAREIHRGSERRRAGFLAVNCAAFPDTLLESELFGHVRGSFTGAERDNQGLSELADRGTLFRDEVCETSTCAGSQPRTARSARPWRRGLWEGPLLPPRGVSDRRAAAARPGPRTCSP